MVGTTRIYISRWPHVRARLDSLSDVIESNDELVGTDNNIAHLEVMISKQGLVIIPLDANGNEVPPEEHGEASSRLLEVLSTTTATFDFKSKTLAHRRRQFL